MPSRRRPWPRAIARAACASSSASGRRPCAASARGSRRSGRAGTSGGGRWANQSYSFGRSWRRDLEDVAEALGHEQRAADALALEQRVRRDGRAVDEELDVGRRERRRCRRPCAIPSSTPTAWFAGVDEVFVKWMRFVAASKRTRSVKVPPTSTPSRTLMRREVIAFPVVAEAVAGAADPGRGRARSVRRRIRGRNRSSADGAAGVPRGTASAYDRAAWISPRSHTDPKRAKVVMANWEALERAIAGNSAARSPTTPTASASGAGCTRAS